jgi:hypothetical protein
MNTTTILRLNNSIMATNGENDHAQNDVWERQGWLIGAMHLPSDNGLAFANSVGKGGRENGL